MRYLDRITAEALEAQERLARFDAPVPGCRVDGMGRGHRFEECPPRGGRKTEFSRALLRRFNKTLVDRIMGTNVTRLFDDVEQAALGGRTVKFRRYAPLEPPDDAPPIEERPTITISKAWETYP
jgi:hypothetical protein